MADLGGVARRPAIEAAPLLRQGVSIEVLPAEARFSLRLPMAQAAAGEVAGFALDMAMNRYKASGRRWSARLGPNEWLLGGPEDEGEAIAGEIEAALDGSVRALTEISHRQVAFEAAGPAAAAVLNAGCPLDLSDRTFPAGAATRTLLGKAEIVLIRPAATPSFRVECWRSFADYVHAFLAEAARDCPASA
jgi:sarcosine oxidase subunit gamma